MRLRSSLAVNRDLLIDFGPDVTSGAFRWGFDLRKVRYWLQTHAHSDHFCAGHIVTRHPDYAVQDVGPLSLYASGACLRRMESLLLAEEEGASWENLSVRPHAVHAGERFRFGRYEAVALPAVHDEGALLYAISDGTAWLLYATDTTEIPEEAEDMLCGVPLDCAGMDHTYGPGVRGGGHMNADQVEKAASRLREKGLLRNDAPVYATHLSHEGMLPHDEMQAYAMRRGYQIAWDGLTLEI
jgi:phosphoribosyl 1,2-cyclic phosphate phosphodiesterase